MESAHLIFINRASINRNEIKGYTIEISPLH